MVDGKIRKVKKSASFLFVLESFLLEALLILLGVFPKNKRQPNIFILKPDPYLAKEKKVSLSQLFVDLWNLSEWYAKDFCQATLLEIKKRLNQ